MNWLGLRHGKELSDAERLRRGRAMFIALAAAIAVIVFIPSRRDGARREPPAAERRMDETLDSVILSLGYGGCEVYFKGDVEYLTERLDCPAADRLAAVNTHISDVMAMKLDDSRKMRLLERAVRERDSLAAVVEEYMAGDRTVAYSSRRRRLRLADGRHVTFFQQLHGDGGVRTAYLQETSGGDAASAYERLQRELGAAAPGEAERRPDGNTSHNNNN